MVTVQTAKVVLGQVVAKNDAIKAVGGGRTAHISPVNTYPLPHHPRRCSFVNGRVDPSRSCDPAPSTQSPLRSASWMWAPPEQFGQAQEFLGQAFFADSDCRLPPPPTNLAATLINNSVVSSPSQNGMAHGHGASSSSVLTFNSRRFRATRSSRATVRPPPTPIRFSTTKRKNTTTK